MRLKIVQCGELSLRDCARPLSPEEIRSDQTKQLIELMRETMYDASGVGLAAPQVGLPLQLVVIEDKADQLTPDILAVRERTPVPFHVVINPRLSIEDASPVEFFEGCLSVSGFTGLVPRARAVKVECLNEHSEPVSIEARGWYARILQHEIDHLNGTLYLDRMKTRTFMSQENFNRYWKDKPVEQVMKELELNANNSRQ